MKNRIIISSILTIALCLSMIAGSTFALFTSESKVDVTVSAGTVDVDVNASALTLGSTLGTALGTAELKDNVITLTNLVPGDYVTFTLTITNKSNVTVNYRALVKTVEDKGLLDGLVITYNKEFASKWATLDPTTANVSEVVVTISLPETAGDAYQNKSCKLAYIVEAVQGNVDVVDDVADLKDALVNGDHVILQKDVSTSADTTAPYGNKVALVQNGGVLDGNGNTIHIETNGDHYGIMTNGGTIKNATITGAFRGIVIMSANQDVIIDNVTITGGVGYAINTAEHATVEGVDLIVTNSTICGWSSFAGLESASFTNCHFGQGTYWGATSIYGRVIKPYVSTTFTNCTFVESANIDLSELAEGEVVVFENCTIDGVLITAENSDFSPETYEEWFTFDLPSWASSYADCVVFR